MIGNDVIDLSDRDCDPSTLHPRFDARVFADDELQAVEADGGARLRWRLWAAKEAAYKAVKKAHSTAMFSPSQYRVELSAKWDFGPEDSRVTIGTVVCKEARCDLQLEERDEMIHAIARLEGVDETPPPTSDAAHDVAREVLWGATRLHPRHAVDRDPHLPGQFARRLAIDRIAAVFGIDVDALEVGKRGRIPEILLNGEATELDLSLSHHGAVVAFACEVPRVIRGSACSIARYAAPPFASSRASVGAMV